MDAPLALQMGQILARDYRVLRGLAAGGMGSVYLVEQLSTGKQRALKVMHPQYARDEESRARFAQEARAGARIKSEHVVEVVAAGVDDETGIPWLAMELLDGEELSQRVRRAGRLPPGEVLEIYRQLGHGLGEAHRQGLVHRDLKPENIFIGVARRQNAPFTLKILDFGVAKLAQENQAQTEGTRPVGTPRWMAPEQSEERARITPATDVWAMGLLAFYLLTGRYYWRAANSGGSLTTLLRELVLEPIEAPSARAAGLNPPQTLPAGFDGWFAGCVVRDAKARFPDAEAAMQALVPLLENAPPWDANLIPVLGSAKPLDNATGEGATLQGPSALARSPAQTHDQKAQTHAQNTTPPAAATRPARPRSSPGFSTTPFAQPPPAAERSTPAMPAASPLRARSSPASQEEIERALAQQSISRAPLGAQPPSSPSLVPSSLPSLAPAIEPIAPSASPIAPSAPPIAQPVPPKRSRAPILAGAALVAVAAISFAALRSRGPAPVPAAVQPSPLAPTPAPIAAAPAPQKPSEPDAFTFIIQSIPSGADVFEGDTKLGETPLQLSLENAPLHTAPRHFRIAKDGYQAYSLVQGPSNDAVKLIETLGPAEPEQKPATRATKAHRESTPGNESEPELRLRR